MIVHITLKGGGVLVMTDVISFDLSRTFVSKVVHKNGITFLHGSRIKEARVFDPDRRLFQ